jgi:hypothetical protein
MTVLESGTGTPPARLMDFRSRWLVGSSSSSISGLPNRAWASSTRTLSPAFQLLHLLVTHLLRDAKTVEQHRRLRLGLVAVHLGKLTLQLADLMPSSSEKSSWHTSPPGDHFIQPACPMMTVLKDRMFIKGELVLLQKGDPLPWTN